MTTREIREHKAFELAHYIVTYADGQTATVPIRSEIDVDDYRQKAPTPLPGAQIGWTRRYPDSDSVRRCLCPAMDQPPAARGDPID